MGHLLTDKDRASLIETTTTNKSVCEVEVNEEAKDFLEEVIHDPSTEEKKF